MYSLPPIASIARPKVDLSVISRGELDVPAKSSMFQLSPSLITEYYTADKEQDRVLFGKILDECRKYADERKELTRAALKKRQRDVTETTGVSLSPTDKSKLRSRREAKVHRVKEREFDAALKDVIRWFISQRNHTNYTNTSTGMNSNNGTATASINIQIPHSIVDEAHVSRLS